MEHKLKELTTKDMNEFIGLLNRYRNKPSGEILIEIEHAPYAKKIFNMLKIEYVCDMKSKALEYAKDAIDLGMCFKFDPEDTYYIGYSSYPSIKSIYKDSYIMESIDEELKTIIKTSPKIKEVGGLLIVNTNYEKDPFEAAERLLITNSEIINDIELKESILAIIRNDKAYAMAHEPNEEWTSRNESDILTVALGHAIEEIEISPTAQEIASIIIILCNLGLNWVTPLTVLMENEWTYMTDVYGPITHNVFKEILGDNTGYQVIMDAYISVLNNESAKIWGRKLFSLNNNNDIAISFKEFPFGPNGEKFDFDNLHEYDDCVIRDAVQYIERQLNE